MFRFLYPVIGLQFVHTHKNSIHGCWIWLPALQIQCVLFHEEREEYCCFSWFHLLCSHVSRLADITVKDRVIKTITWWTYLFYETFSLQKLLNSDSFFLTHTELLAPVVEYPLRKVLEHSTLCQRDTAFQLLHTKLRRGPEKDWKWQGEVQK